MDAVAFVERIVGMPLTDEQKASLRSNLKGHHQLQTKAGFVSQNGKFRKCAGSYDGRNTEVLAVFLPKELLRSKL